MGAGRVRGKGEVVDTLRNIMCNDRKPLFRDKAACALTSTESAKAVTAKYTAEVPVTKRTEVELQIQRAIEKFISVTLEQMGVRNGLQMAHVAITDFDFSRKSTRPTNASSGLNRMPWWRRTKCCGVSPRRMPQPQKRSQPPRRSPMILRSVQRPVPMPSGGKRWHSRTILN